MDAIRDLDGMSCKQIWKLSYFYAMNSLDNSYAYFYTFYHALLYHEYWLCKDQFFWYYIFLTFEGYLCEIWALGSILMENKAHSNSDR